MIMVDEDVMFDGKFGYENSSGEVEYVEIYSDLVLFYAFDGVGICGVNIKDIPKMIKALQAAYDYSKK
jgi:hypothetical protein